MTRPHPRSPLFPYTTLFRSIPVEELIGKEALDTIVERTKTGGGELVKLMGTSAWYAPGSAAAQMVESIVKDDGRIFPCCVYLEGEYGLEDIFLGVPVQLGRNGVERILELQLNEEEKKLLKESEEHVRSVMEVYKGM